MYELKFENTLQLTESEYLAAWSIAPKWRPVRILKFAVLVILGVVCLFTAYTLLLGLVLLGLAGLTLFTPGIVWLSMRHKFRDNEYLREALTYGVSEQKLWVKSDKIDASVPWSMLFNWREAGDWLVLSPLGIPPVFLSLARLREEGVYGRVRALAASHAPEFKATKHRSH